MVGRREANSYGRERRASAQCAGAQVNKFLSDVPAPDPIKRELWSRIRASQPDITAAVDRFKKTWQRIEAKRDRDRLRQIWGAILESESLKREPYHIQVKRAPRIRGAGAAARRAGF